MSPSGTTLPFGPNRANDRSGRLQPYKASKKLNGAHGLPDPKIGVQLEDSERSHFVTSFSSLQLLLACV